MLMKNNILILLLLSALLSGCREATVPKPKGYFRIDFPEKAYRQFDPGTFDQKGMLPLSFQYPVYGNISFESESNPEPGWFNIDFPAYRAKVYLTYKNVNDDLASLVEEPYRLNVKNHITKADAINEEFIADPQHNYMEYYMTLKEAPLQQCNFLLQTVQNISSGDHFTFHLSPILIHWLL